MNDPAVPTWEGAEYQQLLPILYGFSNFQVLRAAVELDLFSRLSAQPGQTQDELATALKLSPHSARLLFLGLCSVGLLVREQGRYHNSKTADLLLVRGRPASAIPFVESAQHLQYQGFFHLAEALRRQSNVGIEEYPQEGDTLYKRMSNDPHLEQVLYDAMNAIWDLCEAGLNNIPELASVNRVLDVAGGSGRVARVLIEKYPQLNVTVFDRPTACARVKANAALWGKESKISTVAGDLLEDAFPSGFDAINFAHCLEWLSESQILDTLKKAYQALPSGGQAFCFQFAVNDAETGPMYSARLSLYFYVVETGAGMAYPAGDLERLFTQAGFVDVKVRRELPFEHVFVSGRKP